MKLKKKYRFDNNRQIWRIIPNNNGKLIIEERETEQKQAYYHCLHIESGKKILSNFQPDDKFWVGIESVRDDVIFFHKYAKPDMPKHRGIYAFDFIKKEFIWKNPDLTYLFFLNTKLYAFNEKFEGRNYFAINPDNGEIVEEISDDHKYINCLRDESLLKESGDGYLFPEVFTAGVSSDPRIDRIINSLKNENVISGKIEYLINKDMLMVNFHSANSKGSLDNFFKAVDLSKGKYILEEVINKETRLFFTDSFFVKDNILFLLFGKTRLEVYKIVS